MEIADDASVGITDGASVGSSVGVAVGAYVGSIDAHNNPSSWSFTESKGYE